MRTLIDGFCASSARAPGAAALEVGEEVLGYGELEARAAGVAASLARHAPPGPLAAVLAYRTAAAYQGVLGVLAAGRGYVPLNPTFPAARSETMFRLSGCEAVVAAPEGAETLQAILSASTRAVTVVSLGLPDLDAWRARYPAHRFVLPDPETRTVDRDLLGRVDPGATAYLLFTSGSTGVPKGVPVSHANVTSYLRYVGDRYRFRPEDRFSQTFDMTFDLSVHDMFVSWTSGACLVAMPHSAVMAPAKHIRDRRLTVWFSVPSVVMMMQRLRSLKDGLFPELRVSLFCGEPLLETWADAWQRAAPGSLVENVYGPTEATIAISHYTWKPRREDNRCEKGIVPIGTIFDGQRGAVVDPVARRRVTRGTPGELWLSGSQVTKGYLGDPEKTKVQYVSLDGEEGTWYRTGDLVAESPEPDAGTLQYLGRVDHQIQINGHRVELQEIDQAVRAAAGTDAAMAVAWPVVSGRADAVYAFVCGGPDLDGAAIIAACARTLPVYMVPKAVFAVDTMPLNSNGKIDRKKLSERVGELIHERS